ncbi:MAG: TonB-dependent receptor [Ignavibacteriae bacterium]|nr:MAG: TonB-dependent receptor [Ignavibacteriota bacterium]
MLKNYKLIALIVMLFSTALFAQNYKVFGVVKSANTGEILFGANVYVQGMAIGAATDGEGKYEFTLPRGEYTITCSYIGFETVELTNLKVTNNMELNFDLKDHEFSLSVTVLADRAKERETPVAFSNIDKKEMEMKLGSQDVPMILNTTPSVYATMQGGGAGDARINIRGFNQRNIAIMINGVPVNDMENGWVYWSNWDGVGDATSSIQLQRGLSAVNIATPSIGGTMNIITDPTAAQFGGKLKQEFGNDGFLKSTLMASSGLIDDTWAVNAAIVKKSGNGFIDKTWTNAWAYYFGVGVNLSQSNRLELYALGAPQRHGQNSYRQNAAVYSHDFAKNELHYSDEALEKFQEKGRTFNQNWSPVNPSYTGKQFQVPLFGFSPNGGGLEDRHDKGFINERENYFHKPIVNLNWYSQLSNKLSLYTTAYYSGGHGGGTGTYGKLLAKDANGKVGGQNYKFYYGPSPWTRDWNGTIAMNSGAAGDYYVDKKKLTKADGQSLGILRNSRNNQWTIGVLSKAYYKVSENLKTSFGIDWRTAEIAHYREVRDLLGGKYYLDNSDEFNPNKKAGLGDKIAYNYTNTVDWIGGYLQAEYSIDRWTTYMMGGYSTIKYAHTNHFKKNDKGEELTANPDPIGGYQIKGGASYRLNKTTDIYANAGYVAKVPILDEVIDDRSGAIAEDPSSEKFTSFESGINYRAPSGKVAVKANFYFTNWLNRALTRGVRNEDGTEALVFISGLDQRHFGLELEAALKPVEFVRLDVGLSFGNWEVLNDVNAKYKSYDGGNFVSKDYNLYVKGLKVGDQPQTSLYSVLSLYPVKGLSLTGIVRHFRDHYANWNPTGRTNKNDTQQSWKAPNYTVVDLHANYDLPLELSGVKFQVFAHVFNLLDEIYVQDATDNSSYNAFSSNGKTHAADDADVYLGLPRAFNAGISILF